MIKRLISYYFQQRSQKRMYPHVRFFRKSRVSSDCQFEKGVSIGGGSNLHDCTIGAYSYIGSKTALRQCRIGAFSSISHDVKIGLGRHQIARNVSVYPGFSSSSPAGRYVSKSADDLFEEYLPTTIGNDVLISCHVLIPGGISIGDGAVIGAGAIVTNDIPPYAVAVGIPAKVVRMRFGPEEVDFLENLSWWNRGESWLREHESMFSDIGLLMRGLNKPEIQDE